MGEVLPLTTLCVDGVEGYARKVGAACIGNVLCYIL